MYAPCVAMIFPICYRIVPASMVSVITSPSRCFPGSLHDCPYHPDAASLWVLCNNLLYTKICCYALHDHQGWRRQATASAWLL